MNQIFELCSVTLKKSSKILKLCVEVRGTAVVGVNSQGLSHYLTHAIIWSIVNVKVNFN